MSGICTRAGQKPISSGAFTGGPAKGLLHATISPAHAVPGYRGGAVAPHETLTWSQTTGTVTPHQHITFDTFARALVNAPGGVETNRDSVRQWELAGYLGSSTPRGQFDILGAPDTYWEQVADLIGPVLLSWGVRAHLPEHWSGPSCRMSLAEWDAFDGLCAHVHAPENNHTDLAIPRGALDVLARKIWGTSTPPPAPPAPPAGRVAFPLPSGHWFGLPSRDKRNHSGLYAAQDRRWLRTWQAAANTYARAGLVVDGKFGPRTRAAVVAVQSRHRLMATGRLDRTTWDATWA